MANLFLLNLAEKFSNYLTYIDLGIALLLVVFALVVIIKFRAPVATIVAYCISFAALAAAFIFELNLIFYLLLCILIAITVVFLMANLMSLRKYFAQVKKSEVIHTSNPGETIYDSQSLYKTLFDTVSYCSKVKMGAIITFEKEDDLSNVIKNGTPINAPVSQELLITIFYPGTRLHDGAVIIRGNQIVAASVYYTPTTKALTGKYGSRHRAAIGISDITDAITIVVSEETGRISIAYEGEIESVSEDRFLAKFSELMNERKEN